MGYLRVSGIFGFLIAVLFLVVLIVLIPAFIIAGLAILIVLAVVSLPLFVLRSLFSRKPKKPGENASGRIIDAEYRIKK